MDQSVHILVVDDERGIREGCRRILSAEDYAVDVAGDGEEGLEKVRSKPFDLLLVDLMMPRMGGLEMMEQVRAYDPEIIMIVITGFATVETAVDAMKHGAYDYVPKPFTPDQLHGRGQQGPGNEETSPSGQAAHGGAGPEAPGSGQ